MGFRQVRDLRLEPLQTYSFPPRSLSRSALGGFFNARPPMTQRPDRRSPAALAYRGLYRTYAWRQRRARQLAREPWCAMCLADGRQVRASVADHVVPHRGNAELFWQGRLQSLCISCHSSDKAHIELNGYSTSIGEDGWPTDARHYANTGSMKVQQAAQVQVNTGKYKV